MSDEEPLVVEIEQEAEQEVVIGEEHKEEPKEEIADPGQMEGKRRDQSRVPPERFEEVYAKWKNSERKISEFSEKLASNEAVMEEVRKHNKALMEKLETISTKAIDAIEQPRTPPGQTEEPPAVTAARKSVEELEDRKAEALDRLDSKEVIRIDKELRKLERVLDGYEFYKAEQAKKASSKPDKPQKQPDPQEQTTDPDIAKFISETPWYQKDPIMTGAAKEYDLYLMQKPEWSKEPLAKRLAEVKRVIEEKFKPSKSTRPSGAESGLNLQRPSSGQRTVKLTQQQIAVAAGLGLTNEEYAKQLNFIGGTV